MEVSRKHCALYSTMTLSKITKIFKEIYNIFCSIHQWFCSPSLKATNQKSDVPEEFDRIGNPLNPITMTSYPSILRYGIPYKFKVIILLTRTNSELDCVSSAVPACIIYRATYSQ